MYDGGEKLVYSAGFSHSSILMKAESRSDGTLSGESSVMMPIVGDGVTPAGSGGPRLDASCGEENKQE